MMACSAITETYGVPTKALNQALKRNRPRFPADFSFKINLLEKSEVVTICDHLTGIKFSKSHPIAFTEHGAIMAATVLNSPQARGTGEVGRDTRCQDAQAVR